MSITIRNATPEDASIVYEMITELARYENAEHSVVVGVDELRQQLSQENAPFHCAIAECDGLPCGFALYFYAYSTWEGSRTLYLEDLFVKPGFRSAGAGFALMSHLADTAHKQNCRRFEWSVLDWNESAIAFYERLGARQVSGWTRYRLDTPGIECLRLQATNSQANNRDKVA